MSSEFGKNIKFTIFGQSHSDAVGVVIDGLPAGEKIDFDELQSFLDHRAPGNNEYSSPRLECDVPEFLSGIVNGVTCGAPLYAIIRNSDAHSSDYEKFRNIPRPGHADFPAFVKYSGYNDIRGGGHFSARLTAPMCIAGGIVLQLLRKRGITVGAHISRIAGVNDELFDPVEISSDALDAISKKPFPVIDDLAGERMCDAILAAKADGDSVGGIIECAVLGMPVGFGSPIFDGVENAIASAVFAIPAVKGIEFGAGFAVSDMRGSENNDPFVIKDGKIKTSSNNHGGILGGLTSGMPIIFRTAFKPTPSIAISQHSVNLSSMSEAELTVTGRHDPCVVLRAVPCVISAAAISIADILLA